MSSPSRGRAVGVLVAALIVDMLAFTCILPLFPSIVAYYGKDENRDFLYDFFVALLRGFQDLIGAPHSEKYNNVFFGGLLGSLFSLLQFLSSPLLGALSDVYGRRTMLLLSCLGTFLSYTMWLRASTFSLFVLSRIVGGLSKANINVATAIISDVYAPSEHPKGMALIGVSYSVGFIVGPMIGAYFSTIAPTDALFTTPAQFAIAMTIIQFMLLICFLPETLSFSQAVEYTTVSEKSSRLLSPLALFNFEAVNAPAEKRLEMRSIGITYFIYLFLYAGLEFTLPFLTHLRFNYTSMQQGKIYLFCGLLMLPIQGHFVRKTPMHKQKRVAEIGVMCIIPAYMLVAFAHTQAMLYAGLFLYAIASGTVVTALTSCVSSVHTQSDKGALSGVFRSLGALARALGPIFASSLFWMVGPAMCYSVGAILLTIPLLLLKRIPNPVEEKKNE